MTTTTEPLLLLLGVENDNESFSPLKVKKKKLGYSVRLSSCSSWNLAIRNANKAAHQQFSQHSFFGNKFILEGKIIQIVYGVLHFEAWIPHHLSTSSIWLSFFSIESKILLTHDCFCCSTITLVEYYSISISMFYMVALLDYYFSFFLSFRLVLWPPFSHNLVSLNKREEKNLCRFGLGRRTLSSSSSRAFGDRDQKLCGLCALCIYNSIFNDTNSVVHRGQKPRYTHCV